MTRYTPKPALLFSAIVTTSALLLTACGPSTDTKGKTALSIQGTTPSGTVARTLTRATTNTSVGIAVYDNQGAADGTLTLTKAWMVIKEVDMEKEDEVEDDGTESSTEFEIEFVGPFVVDLLTSTASPELPALQLDAAFYDEIEMDIEKLALNDLDATGNPLIDTYPELEHYSLYLEGTYTSEDGTYLDIPFALKYDQTDEFEMSGAALGNGVAVEAGQAANLIVAFRMASWFRFDDPDTNEEESINIGQAIETIIESDGSARHQLILDGKEGLHEDVMDVIEDNIEDSADFGEDRDDNGELGSDEDEDDDDDWDDDQDS